MRSRHRIGPFGGALVAILAAGLALAGCARQPPEGTAATSPAAASASPTSASPVPGPTTPAASSSSPTPSGPVHLVGLGDSVMAGKNCDCDGITAGLAAALQGDWKVPVSQVNLGESGATTEDLLDDLTNDPRTMSEVTKADVVVVIIGANDLTDDLDTWRRTGCGRSCYLPHTQRMQTRLSKILARITNLEAGRPFTLVVDGYWNILADGRIALKQGGWPQLSWSRAVTAAVDSAIEDAATADGGRYVELRSVFTDAPDRLLADDGDHPNAAGVAAIVRANLHALGE